MNISERVKELKLPSGSYAVFGSGPMAARGIRETNDIDIVVTRQLFRKLAADMSWQALELRDHHSGLKKGDYEIFHTWAPGSWDLEALIKDADIIDGVPYVELRSVLEWKRQRDSVKDQHDVALIEKYLAEHQ